MTIAILEDKFFLYKQHGNLYHVVLTQGSINYYLEGNENSVQKTILIDDIAGCSCMKARAKDAQHHAFLSVFSYPLTKKGKRKRKKQITVFEVPKSTYEENLRIAKLWREEIIKIRDLHLSNLSWLGSSALIQAAKVAPLPEILSRRKKLLIFINPNSGPGIATENFMKKAKPILEEAEVLFETIVTKRANAAYELIREMKFEDLMEYSGIITVSGDGLLYEVYKGLLHRDDCSEALTIPVGTIPGGTGNGLARSIGHLINEPYLVNPVLVSTLNIVHPVSIPLDLAFIQTEKEQSLSFLSLGLGLMSDIDIESERLRAIGDARFTVWSFRRVLSLRKYRIRVSFKRARQKDLNSTKEYMHSCLTRSQTVEEVTPNGLDEYDASLSPQKRCHSLTSCDEDSSSLSQMQSVGDLVKIARSNWTVHQMDGDLKDAHSSYLSPPGLAALEALKKRNLLEEPLPEDWETIEDDFISVYAGLVPFIGGSIHFSPRSTFTDGVIYLCLMNSKVSRINVIKYLLGLESGKHMEVPGVETIPVTALRFEPLCKTGYLTIDGEVLDFGPLHATVLPSLGRFIVRPSRDFLKM